MLEEKMLNDYKEAMKARDTLKSSVLSFLRAQMLNTAIDKKKNKLEDNEIIAVVKKQVKQRQDSIEQFKKGNRPELAEKEQQELKILEFYLPKQLSVDEIKKIVQEAITALGASGPADIGRVMKEVMLKVGPAADGKTTSELVRQALAPPLPNPP